MEMDLYGRSKDDEVEVEVCSVLCAGLCALFAEYLNSWEISLLMYIQRIELA